MCPTAAVIILLKLNQTARNSCPAERAHHEQTCPQNRRLNGDLSTVTITLFSIPV